VTNVIYGAKTDHEGIRLNKILPNIGAFSLMSNVAKTKLMRIGKSYSY
jgi:hypothetical protein